MKNIPDGLNQHLAGEATTLCRCWKMTCRDGSTIGFTDHDRNIRFDDLVYEANSGVDGSEIEQTLGFARDNQEITGALTSGRLGIADIRAGRFDAAQVEIWMVNWINPEQRFLDRSFALGGITEEDGRFRAELCGASAGFSQIRGRRFQRACDADLGDTRCGIDLDIADYWCEAEILALLSELVVVIDGAQGFESGWFRSGKACFLDGSNKNIFVGIAEHIVQDTQVKLHLWSPAPHALSIGTKMHLTVGCNKSFSQCRDRFGNEKRFCGFPHIPGNDFLLGHAISFDTMDGGPLVP
jgi:uncharacterized phage protein (TIGR02218 family)